MLSALFLFLYGRKVCFCPVLWPAQPRVSMAPCSLARGYILSCFLCFWIFTRPACWQVQRPSESLLVTPAGHFGPTCPPSPVAKGEVLSVSQPLGKWFLLTTSVGGHLIFKPKYHLVNWKYKTPNVAKRLISIDLFSLFWSAHLQWGPSLCKD